MQKTRILHIIKSLGRGGAETLLPETLKIHDREKFEFHYIYFLPWKDQMVPSILNNGGNVTCIPSSNNLKMLLKSGEIIKYIKANQIDLIHCHLPWSGFLGRIVFKKTGIPLIYTEHNIQEKYHPATKTLNKISFNQQSIALGVSEDVTRSIKNNIKPTIKVQTLLNGVNTEKFEHNASHSLSIREKYNIPLNALVVGNMAVFRKQKGLLDWVEAFKLISEKNINTFGLLVGAGPEFEVITQHIKKLGLENKIILAGLQEDTVAYFSAMDIFMMSSHFEGLPIALLEAMSTECAIVSTKAGGVVEVIEHGKNGLLCEVGDSSCLADNVNQLVANEVQLKNLKLKARQRVLEKFSLENMVESLEEIYSSFDGN